MEYDMDQARAARLEAQGSEDGHVFTFGGQKFELPSEMPLDAGEHLAQGNYRGFMTVMLNGQGDAFFALRPSVNDLTDLVEWMTEAYLPGSTVGESSASSPSPTPTGKKSRQRSPGATA